MSRGNPNEQQGKDGQDCESSIPVLSGLADDDEQTHWIPPPVPPQMETTVGTGLPAEPFQIYHPEYVGRILSSAPVTPSSLSRPERCCATTYSAIWDPEGRLYAAIVDNMFCEAQFARIKHSVVNAPEKWVWEDQNSASDRLKNHFSGNSWSSPPSDKPTGDFRWDGSPSLLGHALDKKEEQEILLKFEPAYNTPFHLRCSTPLILTL